MITKEVLIECQMNKIEDSKYIMINNRLRLSSDTLDKTVSDSDNKYYIKVTLSFLPVFKKGGWIVDGKNEDSYSITNNLIIHNNSGEIVSADNLLIDLYQNNDSNDVDCFFINEMNSLIINGFLTEEIENLDKHRQEWSEEEAKYAFEIYKASKKMDTIGVEALIEDYIRTGKLKRTINSIKFKLANFKHLESEEGEGLGNMGQVFKDIYYKNK